MGSDEYRPLSQSGENLNKAGGIGYTVIDALDTMLIMGLDEEVQRARQWVRDNHTFDRSGNFNMFEVHALSIH